MSRSGLFGVLAGILAVLLVSLALQRASKAPVENPSDNVTRTAEVSSPDRSVRVSSFPNPSAVASAPTPPPMRRTTRDARRQLRSLDGRVTLLDGTPLVGATVSINNGSTSSTTDEGGFYLISELPEQVWGVVARHDEAVTSMIRNLDNDIRTLDFLMQRKAPVRFVAKVFDAVKQDPLKEFSVSISGREILKDSAVPGRFEISHVFTGDQLSFRIEAPGTVPRDVREWIPSHASGTVEREYALGTGGTITGRVIRGSTRQPVAGAIVSTRSFGRGRGWNGGGGGQGTDTSTTATTDENGKFMLTKLNPGPIIVQVTPEVPLMQSTRFAGELQHHEVRDIGDIEIGAGGTIIGKVVRLPAGEPVGGVRVDLAGSGIFGSRRGDDDAPTSSATTNAEGTFEFAEVAPGAQQVTVREFRLRETVIITSEETREVTLRLGSGSLAGLVLKEGEPVVNARVSLSRPTGSMFSRGRPLNTVESDENGEFRFSDLAPGKWQVRIRTEDDRTAYFEADIPGEGTLERTYHLPSGDLVGKVVDANNQPVADARISVMSAGSSNSPFGNTGGPADRGWGGRGGVRSGPDGTFRLEDREPGPLVVQAHKEDAGYSEPGEGVVPEQGDSPEVILKLSPGGGGSLVSVVLNLETGGPIQNAYLSLSTSKGQVSQRQRRGEDGVLTVRGLPAGSYYVEVGATGYTTSQKTVQISDGSTVQITDVLSAGGGFRWTLMDQNGAAFPGAACQLVPLDSTSIENVRQGVTDANGTWLVRGLVPGTYSATCTTAEGQTSALQVTINAGGYVQETTVLQ